MRLWRKKKKKPIVHEGKVYIDFMPWAGTFGPRCKARLKKGEDPEFHGRCDLKEGHYVDLPDDHHCLERGMVWVRWTETGQIRYETPQYELR